MADTVPPPAPAPNYAPDIECIKKQQTVINMLALLLSILGAKSKQIEECYVK